MSILSNPQIQQNPNFINLTGIFMEFNKMILKVIWKSKEPRIVKVLLKKESTERRITTPDIKTYYKATVIKDSVILVQG